MFSLPWWRIPMCVGERVGVDEMGRDGSRCCTGRLTLSMENCILSSAAAVLSQGLKVRVLECECAVCAL